VFNFVFISVSTELNAFEAPALCSSSLPCFVSTIATSGTVYRTVQPMDTTSQALTGYPALITNVVVGVHVYQIKIEKLGPSSFKVITSGPKCKCRLETNKTADDGVITTENKKTCNQVSTVDVTGYSQLSFKLSTP
jgi:hypothetical protein